jgi:U3 small nucleolar RNA-associated protein 12
MKRIKTSKKQNKICFKFEKFLNKSQKKNNRKRLSFNHSRTLKLDDDVLCVKISPNGRLIAVALLDTTVKIFFMDSLKVKQQK